MLPFWLIKILQPDILSANREYTLFSLRISVWRILMSQKGNIPLKIKTILPSGDGRGKSKYAIYRLPKLERSKLTFKLTKVL